MSAWKKVLRIIATVVLGLLDLAFALMIVEKALRGVAVFMVVLFSSLIAMMYIPRKKKAYRTLETVPGRVQSTLNLQRSEQRKRNGRLGYKPASEEVRLNAGKYAVLDVETTGLSPEADRIIEIAVVRIDNGEAVESLEKLVNPGIPIPAKITRLTGITDADVKNAPSLGGTLLWVRKLIEDVPVVAHNATFDMGFITAAFNACGVIINTEYLQYIDTVELARQAFPGLPNYKLDTLISELGLLDHAQDHRALSDVMATAKLYSLCRQVLLNPPKQMNNYSDQFNTRVFVENDPDERRREAAEDKAFHLNKYGMEAESAGDVDKAIRYYEDIVADKAVMPHAYLRLAILYKKRKQWVEVIRVCDAALSVLPGTPGRLCQPEEYEKRRAYAQSKLAIENDNSKTGEN